MSVAADRRAREDLDLFLLALISQGIDTPYRMQSLAGISQGTSLQAIKRLLQHKLIRSSAEGSRGSKALSLTPAGRNRLKRGYRPPASEASVRGDFESLLRTALVMAFIHGDFQSASSILRTGIGRPTQDATQNRSDVPEIASLYKRARRLRTAGIASIEAEILEQLAADLRSRRKA